MLPPGKGVVCVICREVTYPPAWLPPGGILGCFGPWAPRPADVTGRVATEASRLTLAPPPPPQEEGVTRGAERPSSAVATTRRGAQLARDSAAARRSLQIDGGASPRRQGGCRALDTTIFPGAPPNGPKGSKLRPGSYCNARFEVSF